MTNDASMNNQEETPAWLIKLLPLASILLSGAALWYTWIRWKDLTSGTEDLWFEWIRPAFTLVIGIVFLAAAVIQLSGRAAAGWSAFTLGWVLVPAMLFTNLVVLLVRGAVGIIQGEAAPIFEKIAGQPLKVFAIPLIVIALVVISQMISKKNKSDS